MKEVKIIFVDVLADAGEPEPGYFVMTSDGKLYKGNGTATPDYVYSSTSPLPFALIKTIKFANYTATDSDAVILCDGTFTVTLQTVDSYAGNDLFIKNIGSGTITVDAFSTETIDGSLTKSLAQNEGIFIKPIDNTTGWAIIADKGNSSTPTLQSVTDAGNTTTNALSLINGTFDSLVEIYSESGEGTIVLSKDGINKISINASINPNISIGSSLGGGSTLKSLATAARLINFPDQAGTVALLSDITGGAGITRSINNIAINTTAGATASTDYVYFCTGTLTLTLPTCVSNTNRYTVKCISGTLTIACNGAETIDGTTTISVAVEDSVDIISNNTEWKIV